MWSLWQDVRLAVRRFARARGFTTTIVLTLALGIGFATAVLTVANAVLLRRLPVADQDRLVVVNVPLGLEAARAFGRSTELLSSVALLNFEGAAAVSIRDGDRITRLRRSLVSGDFFQVLGADPLLGRTLRPEDDAAGAVAVVVISHRAWQSQFGGVPDVIGRRITTHEDGRTSTVVGVMPAGLDYPRGVDAWTPVRAIVPPSSMKYLAFDVVGRLAPGATSEGARHAIMAYLNRDGASVFERRQQARIWPLPEVILGRTGPAVIAFAAASALLLLITCLNVANLLLVRGLSRSHEKGIRRALGASQGRIVAEQLTEHALLTGLGGILSVGVATLAVRAFVALAPAGLPRLEEIHVDGALLVSAFGLTAVTTLLCAVGPAVWAARSATFRGIGASMTLVPAAASRQTGDRRTRVLRETLVALQVALALIVLSAAGLLGRSLWKLERVDLAFDPSQMVVAELALPAGRYDAHEAQVALYDRLRPVLEVTPGVLGVSPVVSVPYAEMSGWKGHPMREGQTEADVAGDPWVDFEVVSPSFFRTLGLPILQGRAFTDIDRAETQPVVVLSASVARLYWPGDDPIGRRVRLGSGQWAEVVGVVPDPRYRDLREARPTMYFPLRQSPFPFAPPTLVLRTGRTPSDVASAIRGVLAEVAPDVNLARTESYGALLAGPLAQPRMNAVLLAVFAGAAMGLSAIGLFGIFATTVRQRTREFGIRMALGATAADVVQLVVGRGVAVVLVGVLVGLFAALPTNNLLAALLFETSPFDVWTLGGVVALVLGVSAAAAVLPARASARIAPATALRAD